MAAYGYIQPSNIFSALLIVSQILHLLHAIFYGIKKNYSAHFGTSMFDSSHSATAENKPFRFIIFNQVRTQS